MGIKRWIRRCRPNRSRKRTGKDAWNRKVSGVFFCFLNRFSRVLLMNSNVAALNKVQTLIVIGNGMVGHHCVEQLIERGALDQYRLHVFSEEPMRAYDRVHLSEYFAGKTAVWQWFAESFLFR